jgi:SAM-dependent MidA family methyltransferase
MTTSTIPTTINPLSPNGFMLTVNKLPDLSYFCQQANLPAINLGVADFTTPLSVQPIPGEMLTYDQLDVQFLVDANMANYKAIHEWIVGLGFPEKWEQYSNFISHDTYARTELSKNFSDATLSILSATNTVVQTIEFKDLFPISLESLVFQSTNTDVTYLTGHVVFRYGYYKFL